MSAWPQAMCHTCAASNCIHACCSYAIKVMPRPQGVLPFCRAPVPGVPQTPAVGRVLPAGRRGACRAAPRPGWHMLSLHGSQRPRGACPTCFFSGVTAQTLLSWTCVVVLLLPQHRTGQCTKNPARFRQQRLQAQCALCSAGLARPPADADVQPASYLQAAWAAACGELFAGTQSRDFAARVHSEVQCLQGGESVHLHPGAVQLCKPVRWQRCCKNDFVQKLNTAFAYTGDRTVEISVEISATARLA